MIYYLNPTNNQVYGYDPVTQQALINQAIANGWTLVPVWPLPPSNEELMAECQSAASGLLYETDWTTIPDVASTANNPYLTNQAAFISYRNAIRKYAVNPVPNPIWPTMPTAQWSS